MNIGSFLSLLQHVKSTGKDQWQADCPCDHSTPQKHLSIGLKDDKILLTCFGSHTAEEICHALRLELADLFIKPDQLIKVEPKIVATYDYTDEENKPLFQVVRYEPKDFRQRHRNGSNEWVWNLEGVRRVLYHLPDVLISSHVYMVEGEKDADNLISWGRIATTSPQGASAWKPEYADFLKGKRVTIIPDNDAPGKAYGKQVAKSLQGLAEVDVILLSEFKDISDWLGAGNDIETLDALKQDISALFTADKPKYYSAEDSIIWHRVVSGRNLFFKAENLHQERTGIHARIIITVDELVLSWHYMNVEKRDERSSLATDAHASLKGEISKLYTKEDLKADLSNFCAGLWEFHLSQFVEELKIGDIQPLLYRLNPFVLDEGGTILYAPPGRGKSQTGLIWAISIDAGLQTFWQTEQSTILYINLERSGKSLERRILLTNKVLGLPERRSLLRLNARGKTLQEMIPICRRIIKANNVKVIFLDSISRAGVGDLTENLSGNRVIDALSSLCPTWVALGHTPRASEDHIFGSVMMDAGADICVQLSSETKDGKLLGIGYQITKQNDTGYSGQQIFALEFDNDGLKAFRKAKPFEFPQIDQKRPQDMLSALLDYVASQESQDATATEIANEFGYDRANVSRLLSKSENFIVTRKVKHSVYYGVK